MPHLYATATATYFEDSARTRSPCLSASGGSLSNHERRTNLWPKPALC